MARNSRSRRAAVGLAMVLALAALGLPATALAETPPPPPMTGTQMFINTVTDPSGGNVAVDSECAPRDPSSGTSTGDSSGTFSASGESFGTYMGPYEVTGSYAFGPIIDVTVSAGVATVGAVYHFEEEFTIHNAQYTDPVTFEARTATVTGTKELWLEGPPLASLVPFSYGVCQDFEDFDQVYQASVVVRARYEALIHTDGGTFRDSGYSQVQVQEVRPPDPPCNGCIPVENFRQDFVSTSPVVPINSPATITLSPSAAVNNVGTQHTVTATVRNLGDSPVPGADVDFTIAGSINTTRSCTTDSSGTCSISYSGPSLPGADLIVGCADSDGNGVRDPGEPCGEATKAWILPTSTAGQVTGGGHVLNPPDGEEVAFGFNAKSSTNGLHGNCTVVDKAPTRNVKIKCLTVDTLIQSGNTATFFGQAEINGLTTSYRIDVTDNGEPGRNNDTFSIQTASGYSAGGLLDNGNVQVHN